MARNDNSPQHSRFLILASVCVVVAALYFAQDVLIPIALAVLLSFLLAPMVSRMEKWRLPRVIATIIVVLVAVSAVGGIGYVVYKQAISLAEQLPGFEGNIVHKFANLRPSKTGVINKAQEAIEKVGKDLETPTTQTTQPTTAPVTGISPNSPSVSPEAPQGSEQNPFWVLVRSQQSRFEQFKVIFSPLVSPLGTAFVVLIFTIFILLGREDLRDRLIRLFGRGQLTLTTQALDDAATRISRYLMMQSLVNSCYGIVIGLGLWLIGVPNPALFGLMCAMLRFIPYIGPWIGASLPLATSLALFPGYHQVLEALSMFIIVELITNNAVEPWLYGSSTGMSTLAVLVSAIFWAWLWGPVGLLLSTPLTVVLVVLGKYVPQLQFIDILLGDEPVLSQPVRVYQRLLALDQEEASELLHEFRKTRALDDLYDNVLIPALAMAEMDRHNGQLDERHQTFIRQSIRTIIEELGDEERILITDQQAKQTVKDAQHATGTATIESSAMATGGNGIGIGQPSKFRQLPRDCVINIICLPAHHETDEIVDLMLAQLLEFSGYCAVAASHAALAGEMIEIVAKKKADLVVISALPPAAVSYARYLCKRVHAAHPDILMAVGLWTFQGDLKKAGQRITCVANVPLVTSLTGMLEQIHQMVQPLVIQRASKTVAT